MKIIRTLTGDLPAGEAGVIDYHEHVIARPPVDRPEDSDLTLCDVDKMAQELQSFARAGGGLLVDASTADFGANAHLRLEASRKAGVPVVGTVGFGQKEHHTQAVKDSGVEELYARVSAAVREGYGPLKLRPGQLKFGTSYQFISPSEEKCARAVARVQRDTGLPLFTHTGVGTMALEQLELLESEGADLSRVCIGHMDRNPDLWLYKQILRRGVFLGLDQVSKVKYCTEQTRISLIMELVRCGYGRRILIGGDLARRSYLTAFGGGPGFSYIPAQFIPRLKGQMMEEGFTHREAEQTTGDLLVNNPRDFLALEQKEGG